MAQDLVRLHRYAENAGRDPLELDVAIKAPLYDPQMPSSGSRRRFSGDQEQILQDVQTYGDIGVTHIIFDIRSAVRSRSLSSCEPTRAKACTKMISSPASPLRINEARL